MIKLMYSSEYQSFLIFIFFCIASCIPLPADTPKHESVKGNHEPLKLQGRITYKPDPQKPWKFGRYYLNGPEHYLAEAVVELVHGDNKKQFVVDTERKIKTHLMDQENFMFIPEMIAIQSGDKVRFKNSEEAYHNVMCLNDNPPFNINLGKNQEYFHEPKIAKGAENPLDIRCVFHGAMKGWICVFNHPYFQQTTKSGAFEFSKIPPGDYLLRVVHPAGGLYLETEVRKLKPSSDTRWNIVLTPEHLKAQSK